MMLMSGRHLTDTSVFMFWPSVYSGVCTQTSPLSINRNVVSRAAVLWMKVESEI